MTNGQNADEQQIPPNASRRMGRTLIEPTATERIAGLPGPADFYCVLSGPASLAGMRGPSRPWPWDAIAAAGFSRVVNLREASPLYDPHPLVIAHSVKLEDLLGNGRPNEPRREAELIERAVAAVLEQLSAGHGVVVHCDGGTGRTGTVIGCVLKALGFSATEVLTYFDTLNRARGKCPPTSGWPESDWQKELVVGV